MKTEVKTEVERLEEKDTVLLKVEVPTDAFNAAVDQAYKRIAGQLVVPGFRKGKIPKAIIDSRIGKEAVHEEALQQALPYYYAGALKDSDIEPVDQPDVDVVQAEEGKPLIFTAKVKVKPEVKLGKYSGLEVDKSSSEPSEDEISSQLDGLRNNFANLEPVEDGSAKEGDFVLIDFEGFLDGEPFEGGQANDYMLEIGSGTFIPGFEEQIVGMKKGDAKDIKVTFPGEYGNDQLAGKEAVFKVAIKEIKEKKLAELNDDFAKQVGFDTLDDLRADIREKIYEVKSKYAEAEVKGEIVDAVTDLSQAEVHDVMIEQEIDDMLEDFAGDVKRQGLDLDQ
ncbi:MAG: trigger factor, partial [Candidatus Aquicultor sp.]